MNRVRVCADGNTRCEEHFRFQLTFVQGHRGHSGSQSNSDAQHQSEIHLKTGGGVKKEKVKDTTKERWLLRSQYEACELISVRQLLSTARDCGTHLLN